MMNDYARSIHLLLEYLGEPVHDLSPVSTAVTAQVSSTEKLEIRNGVNYLTVPPRKPPSLKRRIRGPVQNYILLQPIRHDSAIRLLMLNPGSITVNVNGTLAPPVSLLDEKDELSFDRCSRYTIHVTVYHTPAIGQPLDNEIGTKCPICRSKFNRDTIVYRCPNCSKPLHNERDKDIPQNEKLECATICTVCPSCHADIRVNAGYRYLPEFCRK